MLFKIVLAGFYIPNICSSWHVDCSISHRDQKSEQKTRAMRIFWFISVFIPIFEGIVRTIVVIAKMFLIFKKKVIPKIPFGPL